MYAECAYATKNKYQGVAGNSDPCHHRRSATDPLFVAVTTHCPFQDMRNECTSRPHSKAHRGQPVSPCQSLRKLHKQKYKLRCRGRVLMQAYNDILMLLSML